MKTAYIIEAKRTPVGRAIKGTLKNTRPDDLAAFAIKAILDTEKKIAPAEIDDVIIGCAMPEAEQGMNVARISSFAAGLPYTVPAMTINRFCSSGLQSVALACDRIATGAADIIIAGGTESMSVVPIGGHAFSANPKLANEYPEVYIRMGLTAERVAEKYKLTREAQDKFAYESNMKAISAIKANKFNEEIVPVKVTKNKLVDNKVQKTDMEFKVDEGPRENTSIEALAKLKPAFKQRGTVTAGNSSQMSDGAAAILVCSEKAIKKLKIKPLAKLISYEVCGVPPEIMGIGPVYAIPKALKKAKLKLSDIDIIELNEAFASQSLACINELKLDASIVNVNGGAIALGHPLGATGAILTCKLIYEMKKRKSKYGIVSMCIGAGMGAAGIFENL